MLFKMKGEREHERQDFWRTSKDREELYAPNCSIAGSRTVAGVGKFIYQCND